MENADNRTCIDLDHGLGIYLYCSFSMALGNNGVLGDVFDLDWDRLVFSETLKP